jgi:hypothetical protein
MRTVIGMAILVLGLGVGCANKTPTASTPAAGGTTTSAPAGSGAAPQSAGARAAAPVTAEQLQAAMKTVSASNGSLGMKLMSGDLKGAADDAQKIATAFADAERFFAQAKKQDAVMWAQQARMGASETAAAATAGDTAKAQAARSNMTAQCKQCHAVYREGDAQTGYRIKAGVI